MIDLNIFLVKNRVFKTLNLKSSVCDIIKSKEPFFYRIFVIHIVFKLWWCYAWSYRKLFSNDVPVWNYLALRRFASNFAKNILVPSFDRSRSSYEGCHGKGLEHFLFFGLFWNWYYNCVDFNLYAIKLFGNENPH